MSTGILKKLTTKYLSSKEPVEYILNFSNEQINLNNFLGRKISLNFINEIFCSGCNAKIRKTYSQGFCYVCTKKLACCDMCILKPELCHYDNGTCREPKWGEQNCFIPHVVYLANSSGLKVGITRKTQIPTRWIDQGAVQALPILEVASRYQSGLIEKEISKHISDKTNWRKMLQNAQPDIDLESKRDEIFSLFADEIQKIASKFKFGDINILTSEDIVNIKYPVLEYPNKISSYNFDKNSEVAGTLMGIKGQYLIFDTGVINIRKFTGYKINISS